MPGFNAIIAGKKAHAESCFLDRARQRRTDKEKSQPTVYTVRTRSADLLRAGFAGWCFEVFAAGADEGPPRSRSSTPRSSQGPASAFTVPPRCVSALPL
jgi:hypothetical protein